MKKQQLKAGISAAVIGLLSPLALAVPASAAAVSWKGHESGGAGNNNVNSGYNWVGESVPDNADTWYFPASGVSQVVNVDIAQVSSPIDVGGIYFNGTYSGPSEKVYSLAGDAIDLLGNIEATMTANVGGGAHSVGLDVNLQADVTFKTTGSNTLSIGDTDTTLALGANDLTLDASGGSISLLGKITGTGNLIKAGTGKVNILTTPGAAGFSGSLTVPSGEINAVGSLGNITLSGGTLKGTGTVGDVTMTSGTIAPGASPGCLNSGDFAFTGGNYDVELGGKSASACEYDNVAVTGAVNLGTNTTLNISLFNSFTPAVNDSFAIILNDAEDAVVGTFKGMADGAKVTLGSYTYQINYDGGTGNDVILLVTGTPSAPDTGVGSLMSNPLTTLIATLMVAGVVVGYRIHEVKKAKN
jgi:hypothetical protein